MKNFPLASILSLTTDRLLCSVDELYEILNYMVDGGIYTNQIPRAMRICRPFVIEQCPFLKDVKFYDKDIPFIKEWLNAMVKRFASEFLIEPIPLGVYQHKSPVREFLEMNNVHNS